MVRGTLGRVRWVSCIRVRRPEEPRVPPALTGTLLAGPHPKHRLSRDHIGGDAARARRRSANVPRQGVQASTEQSPYGVVCQKSADIPLPARYQLRLVIDPLRCKVVLGGLTGWLDRRE